MIFTVRDLGFEIGPFLLEGWLPGLSAPLSSFLRGFWSAGCCAGRSFPLCRPAAGTLPPRPSSCAAYRALWRGWPFTAACTWP